MDQNTAPNYSTAVWRAYAKAWLAAKSGDERAQINVDYRARLWGRGLRVLNLTPVDRQLLKSMRIRWD